MPLKRIITSDKNIQLIQDNVDAELTPIQQAPFTGGLYLKNISIKSGQDNIVQHSLGYTPQIFFSGLPNVNSVVWTQPTSAAPLVNQNANPQYINLRCSMTCTVSVWIK